MDAPQSFVDLLHRTFDGRLRIRWSVREHEWRIEQKVGHGMAVPPVRIEEDRDDLICAKDGYLYIMSIRTGDRMPCPKCDYKLRVPVMDTWDIRCPYCQLKGRQTRVVAGFWPLNDRLIDHLRKLDPLNSFSDELAAEADRHNELLLQTEENDKMAPGYAYADENYRRLVGIPLTGYTGKEFKAA